MLGTDYGTRIAVILSVSIQAAIEPDRLFVSIQQWLDRSLQPHLGIAQSLLP